MIDDALFERYVQGSDFIRRYVFRRAACPARRVFVRLPKRRACAWRRSLPLAATTPKPCAAGTRRFAQQRSKVQAQGFDARFQRTWEFYLAYCEAGFDARSIDVVQYTLIKDGERSASSGTLL